ncbi:MAG: hypothetical protein HFJ72_07040 [Adlercreutzia sp.]|nr:hypothetical protein [Adlercreutzia sp.]
MRLWVKMLLALSLSCAMGLGALGCSSAPDDEYVGTWTFESVTDGDGVKDEEGTAFVNSLGVTEEVTFNASGTGTLHLFGESRNFIWDRDDEAQEVTMTLEGETITLQLVDGKLRLEGQQEDGGVGYFVFVRNIGNEDAAAEADANKTDANEAGVNEAGAGESDANDSAAAEADANETDAGEAGANDEAAAEPDTEDQGESEE